MVAHQLSAALRCFNPHSHAASCDLSSSRDGRVQVNDPFLPTLAHVLTNMINPRPPEPPPKEQSLLPKYLGIFTSCLQTEETSWMRGVTSL